ncbi:MAG: alkaline phosphatase D family protein [Bacteroidota bacterium]
MQDNSEKRQDEIGGKISRRRALKYVAAVSTLGPLSCERVGSESSELGSPDSVANELFASKWSNTFDRTWIGGDYWANPMENWCIKDGGVETTHGGGNRNLQLITRRLTAPNQPFEMQVKVAYLSHEDNDGGVGFRLGMRNEIDDYRSHCFEQKGLDAGVKSGELILGEEAVGLNNWDPNKPFLLIISGKPSADKALVELKALDADSEQELGKISQEYVPDQLLGNVAITSNFALSDEEANANRFRFTDWRVSGEAFSGSEKDKFGPILWAMYTLHNSRSSSGHILRLSALTGPMGERDEQNLELQVERDGQWTSMGRSELDKDSWIAIFEIENWPAEEAVPYRVIYEEKGINGQTNTDAFHGTIRANPSGRNLRMAALTCQNDYAFPYGPVAENVEKLDPDIVFFSGDQIYESHGGFGIIRAPVEMALLNYLRKFYQFGWAFRDLMRHAPTVCLPDDHDVFQGNLWGEGGAPMDDIDRDPSASLLGGYAEPARFVNAVHLTNAGHLPRPIQPDLRTKGLSTYFTELVFGDVSFAILADRQWKSSPESIGLLVGRNEDDGAPRDINPPGLELLGEVQENFLLQWGEDWREHKLKAVLSQTVFAGICTHQPNPGRYLKYDFDSSGWPSTARDRGIVKMRPSMALHICGDTHLTSLAQYGIDKQRDANWSFCTPAIAAGWPRWWLPDEVGVPHAMRPEHQLPNTGEYLDGFGNKVYVYAVGNPEEGKSPNRYEKAHEKGSGFGFITFDTVAKTYTLNAYRFLIDVEDDPTIAQFPGWPVTIHQKENMGENLLS